MQALLSLILNTAYYFGMKKVLLSAYACSPFKGSEYSVGWSWATGLAKKGFQVWCLTNTEDYEDCVNEKIKLKLDNLHFIPVKLSFALDKLLLKNSSKVIYAHYYLWKKKGAKLAMKLQKQHKFEIAHHVSYGSLQQGSSLYKLKNCKIIFGPVGGGQMALPIFKPYFGMAWGTEILRKYISCYLMRFNSSLNLTLKKADVLLTVNQETEDLLKSSKYYKGGRDFQVSDSALPVQFEKNVFHEKVRTSRLKLLWVGRLIPRRGLQLSLKALSYLPASVKYQLVIVGDGKQRKYLNHWLKKYNLDSSDIIFKGWIPYDQLHQEYETADVMLFCPLRDTAGLQATEAMGFGLPVITLGISGMRTIVPDNCGIKIDPTSTNGTVKDIAKAIERMYVDYDFRKTAAKNAYEEAINNTWTNKIDKVTSQFY